MFGCKGNLFQYPVGIDGYIYGFCIASQPYYTSTDSRRRGRGTTPRNQQHENFKNGWDNKDPSRSYFGYPYNHQRLFK
ncbi:hypothetical protein Patl1_35431 [Pistacia atlantica]|nr:hypothetical protein Patl1_35431 [Pistacia atlantica]